MDMSLCVSVWSGAEVDQQVLSIQGAGVEATSNDFITDQCNQGNQCTTRTEICHGTDFMT